MFVEGSGRVSGGCYGAEKRVVVAITPVARRVLYKLTMLAGGLELAIDEALRNTDIPPGVKGNMAELYILNQMQEYGFKATATAADGTKFDIDLPVLKVVLFPGPALPPAESFDATKATLFRPMVFNYPDVDGFLWDAKRAVLIPMQITVRKLGTHMADCSFHVSKGSTPSAAHQWLVYCGQALDMSSSTLSSPLSQRRRRSPRSSLPSSFQKEAPVSRGSKPSRPSSGVIWISANREGVTSNSQYRHELCIDFSELANSHFPLLRRLEKQT
jgi:hypothetical protein